MKDTETRIKDIKTEKIYPVFEDEDRNLYAKKAEGFFVKLDEIDNYMYVNPPIQERGKISALKVRADVQERMVAKVEELTYKDTDEFEVVNRAVKYANLLRDVIEKQELFVNISGKKYVLCEGWQVLGALMHCTAKIVRAEKTAEGYIAEAIVSNIDGKELGRAVAICRSDEEGTKKDGTKYRRWNDEFAVLSMAQTRATAKAFRLAFAWILKIAGYEPTPAEEMMRKENERDM